MHVTSAQETWEAALGELQLQVNRANYRTWLGKTVGLSFEGNQFVVGVPTIFVAEYLDKKQRSLIEKTLMGLTKQDVNVTFQVNGRDPDCLRGIRSAPAEQATLSLNPRYTFDSFIAGEGNRLARDAALAVAQNPGHSYNPLFLYGGVGLGKTHLVQAIGNAALANQADVLYFSAEQFTNDLMNAIRSRKTEEFRNKYRTVDMLLVDDIQFISGKERTEESLFYTVNELYNANRQIVVTSDRPPRAIPSLKQQLRSRLEQGLVIDIKPPDLKTRMAILQAKSEQRGEHVDPDILELIASQVQQSIRQLEGALNRVIAYARLLRTSLTPELATHALEDIATRKPKQSTPDAILETVAQSFQLTPEDLKGRKRSKEAALARQLAVYLLKEETGCSLTQIGKELGGRDHHVISLAHQKTASDIETDISLRDKLFRIRQSLYSAGE
ncbi:MAG: chromosomal replication initiator protein DnaA [Chloroflexi bacterium]|nr:chromosomal replication initiator protein DnaA [Chloroflexota bacterium]